MSDKQCVVCGEEATMADASVTNDGLLHHLCRSEYFRSGPRFVSNQDDNEKQQDGEKLTLEQEVNMLRRDRKGESSYRSIVSILNDYFRLLFGLGLVGGAFMAMAEGVKDPSGGIVVIFGLVLLLPGVVLTISGIIALTKRLI